MAVLDGLIDRGHECFTGARLERLVTLVDGEATPDGLMSRHGTHVASILWGQRGSPVTGVAPRCRGLIVPVFGDGGRKTLQLDLSRAILQAIEAGAHIVNLSGGQLTDSGDAEPWLENAVRLCRERNVLLVAAAGNDSCACLHVPAALPAVLAVGAMDHVDRPLATSNWGTMYRGQAILALGEHVLGAAPGGGTRRYSGTSVATPIVSGVAALLLALQVRCGRRPDPARVREVLLRSALPCTSPDFQEHRCLAGRLNIPDAVALLKGELMSEVQASGCGCGAGPCTCGGATHPAMPLPTPPELFRVAAGGGAPTRDVVRPSASEPPLAVGDDGAHGPVTPVGPPAQPDEALRRASVTASSTGREVASGGLVYALGTLGYDFGTEARRDSFKQLMPPVRFENTRVPANPYDARQMADYLHANPSEARSLIWTLNLELTPIYALEPAGPFAREVYAVFQDLMAGQVLAEDSDGYVERVSIPGRLTGRTVRLFSGQVVPVVEPQNTRGLYGWKVNTLVNAAVELTHEGDEKKAQLRRTLGSFLQRIYYDLRNLGTTSQDRALNFSATNVFQASVSFSQVVGAGMELDSIVVEKSPLCRIDSDCWDVKLKFFDPENSRRARKVFRYTVDVSDVMPVTLGEVRSWSTPT